MDEIAIDIIGAHPATELCIRGLQWLQARQAVENVLDMGCGNGILSVVAASVWDARVLAVDISPQALSDARQRIADNHMENRIELLRSDGFIERRVSERGPYDLILLNMLAEFAVSQAQSVKACLRPGGFVMLSGILAWKAADTELTYSNLGFEKLETFSDSPWQASLWRLTAKA
jgi:ribosomal protein L11 methyltransferase